MSVIPEIDNCCDKETYAFYGLAAYLAQVLETGALNLAIVLQLPSVKLVTKKQFDEIYRGLTRKTFGQLLSKAKKLIEITEEDLEFLYEALELRNILVHHYFREHAADFVSEVGRNEMKKELQLIISKFKKADQLLNSIYLPLWKEYGVDEKFIERELSQLAKEAKDRDMGT